MQLITGISELYIDGRLHKNSYSTKSVYDYDYDYDYDLIWVKAQPVYLNNTTSYNDKLNFKV